MPLPDYQSLMLPLMRLASEQTAPLLARDAVSALAVQLGLTSAELAELLPSGATFTFASRVSWAATYLKKAGLLAAPKRGYYEITKRGLDLLSTNPQTINVATLRQYPEFIAFQSPKDSKPDSEISPAETNELTDTPAEALDRAYRSLRDALADEILEKLKQTDPAFFERTVVEVIVKMGYGGTLADAGKAVGRSGDGGIDGIIKEDKLGLDVIYIQAKRWDTNAVSRPDVMQFAGALQGQRASKGIFITTSRFTAEARQYVASIGSKVVLIDGEQLAELMIDHDVGVSTAATYQVKRIDSDYFSEEV